MKKLGLMACVAAYVATGTCLANAQTAPANVINNPALVGQMIETMKLLGGDGSITFTSAWTKSDLRKVQDQITQVRAIEGYYLSNYSDSVIESKLSLEEQQVCEKWGAYTQEQEKYDSLSYHSKSNHNFHLGLSLDAAAGVSGLVAGGKDDDGNAGGGVGAGLDASAHLGFGVGYHSNSEKNKDTVHYYFVRNGLKCDKSRLYQRAVVRLTPDLLTLDPQRTATLIYNHFEERLADLRESLKQAQELTDAVADDPIFGSSDDFMDNLADLRVVSLLRAGEYGTWQAALADLADQYKKTLISARDTLSELKANSFVIANFGDEIGSMDASYHRLINTLSSVEPGGFNMRIKFTNYPAVDEQLASQNFIATLNGTAQAAIKNSSLLPGPDPFNEGLISLFTGTALNVSDEYGLILANQIACGTWHNAFFTEIETKFNFDVTDAPENKSACFRVMDCEGYAAFVCATTEKEILTMQEIKRRVENGQR